MPSKTVVKKEPPLAEVRFLQIPDCPAVGKDAGDVSPLGVQRDQHFHHGILEVALATGEVGRDEDVGLLELESRQGKHPSRISFPSHEGILEVVNVTFRQLNGFP